MTFTTTYNCVKGLNFALLLSIRFNFLRTRGALCVFGAFGAQAQLATFAQFCPLKTPFHKACPLQTGETLVPRTPSRVTECLHSDTVRACQGSLTAGKFMSRLIVGTYPTSQSELSLPGDCLVQRFLANQDLGRFRSEALSFAFCYLVTRNPSSPTRVESLDLYLYVAELFRFACSTAFPPPCIFVDSRGIRGSVGGAAA